MWYTNHATDISAADNGRHFNIYTELKSYNDRVNRFYPTQWAVRVGVTNWLTLIYIVACQIWFGWILILWVRVRFWFRFYSCRSVSNWDFILASRAGIDPIFHKMYFQMKKKIFIFKCLWVDMVILQHQIKNKNYIFNCQLFFHYYY